MGQAISNIFGDGKDGRDENSYQETKRRVVVEGRRGSDGTQQTIPNSFQPNPNWDWEEILNSSRLSASSSTEVVQSSRRVAIVQECGQIGGTQQNVPISLHPELKSSSNTRLSTCPTEVEDSSRIRVVEESGGSGGIQKNILKNLRSELESSSKTWISTCSPKVEDSSRIRVVAVTCGSGGTQQNILRSLQFELKPGNNIRPSTCSSKVEDLSKLKVVEESGGSGGTQQNIPKSLQSELESCSNTRLPTCSSKVEDSRVVEESGGSGGTQQNILRSSQSELESGSNIKPFTCSSKVEYSSKIKAVADSSGSGGTQQNIPKSLQPVLESSSNKRLSTCSSKVKDSSGRVVEDSGQSGGIQQNVSKSSRRKSPNENERMHSSSNDTRQSTSSSTKVATTSIWVVKESDGCGGTQQNVLKSSKEKPRGKKEILPSSSNAIGISTPSTKLPVSCRQVIEESSENGGTHQNVAKSSKKKDKKEILHSSSNDTRQSSSSSTKVIVSSIRVVKESGESGGTKQNVQKSSLPSPHWREKTLNSSANTILSTPSTKVIDSSKWVVEESSQNGGSQQNVTKSSRRKRRSKKAILHSSNTSTTDWVISIPRIEEMIEKLVAESSQTTVKEDKQIKHYRSSHKILLVGEGDFSFSTCLAKAFGSAANMVATSLDSTVSMSEFLELNYGKAISNINELKKRGCMVMHGFDVHNMANRGSVKGMKFDRFIYNFPLAGFFYDKSKEYRLRRNKMLMKSFFENARMMLSENGEVHVSHKCNNGFFREWDLEALALNHGLQLIAELEFKLHDYPGYNTKYGFGGDENFECAPSMTYKFVMKHQASQS